MRRTIAHVLLPLLLGAGLMQPGQRSTELPSYFPEPEILETLPASAVSPHYIKGNNVSEVWSYVMGFPTGYFVNLQFMVTNIGSGDFTGVMIAYLMAPDGEVAILKNTRKYGVWKDRSDPSHTELEIAYHTLRIDGARHAIDIDHPDRGKLFVHGEALTPAFRPGRLRFGKDIYDLTVLAPRLRLSGTVQMPGRDPVSLGQGRGIAIHSMSNASDDRLATGWLRVDTFDAPVQVSFFELMSSQRYRQRRIGFMLLFDHDRLVGHTYHYGRRLLEPIPDPRKKKYPIPAALRFGAEVGMDFRAQAKLHLINRNELLNFLNSKVLRFVLRLITDPVIYQYRAEYELRVAQDGEWTSFDGQGMASLYLLNDPPAVY